MDIDFAMPARAARVALPFEGEGAMGRQLMHILDR